jgi:adenosylhomocysteine nucleosidase
LGGERRREVALLKCGIGKVNAAVGCALLIDRFGPEFVVNTGSAGGLLPELTFGDVVISDGLLEHDVDVTAFGYEPGQIPGLPAVFPADLSLVERAERAVDGLKARGGLPASLNRVRGIIGSGTYSCTGGRHRTDPVRFPGLWPWRMEGAASAQTMRRVVPPVLVIRALSDVAGKESPMKFDEFLPLASRNSSEIVRALVRKGD